MRCLLFTLLTSSPHPPSPLTSRVIAARALAPENTLAAFRRAIEIGVTTIETDMAVTKDDVIVISHDPLLNPHIVRGPDGHWLAPQGPPIRTLTLARLRHYNIGRLMIGVEATP